MSINYMTKFAIGEAVKVISGLYKGRVGVIKDFTPGLLRGMAEHPETRDCVVYGFYTIKSRFTTIEVPESALARMGEL